MMIPAEKTWVRIIPALQKEVPEVPETVRKRDRKKL